MTTRLCTVGGCGEKHQARGRCQRHYNQWRRTTEHFTSSWADQRAALIEDIEHLLGYDTAAHIAAMLGYEKPRSLARRLSRAGRHDLARQVLEGSMTATPTATVPNKYRNDLTAGACYGQLDFTEQPLAAQYVACLGCPVRDLCPEPTPWPKRECCQRGHVWGEKYANGACKACNRAASDDARKRAEEAAVPADVEDLRVQFVVSMRRGGFGWEEIIRDLRTKSTALHALLVAAGMLSLAEDLAEYQESRRRKPGLRPPGRPRKVREVAP